MALAVVRSVTIIAMEQVHRRTEETMAKMVVLTIGVRKVRSKDKRAVIYTGGVIMHMAMRVLELLAETAVA